jgi:CTP:molybdopterin cytidylyltransferase MocA
VFHVLTFNGQRGNLVIFSSFYKNEILTNDEPDGCRLVVMRNKVHLRLLEMEESNVLRDIDEIGDYQELVRY